MLPILSHQQHASRHLLCNCEVPEQLNSFQLALSSPAPVFMRFPTSESPLYYPYNLILLGLSIGIPRIVASRVDDDHMG